MTKRRSLDDALSPEEQAFLSGRQPENVSEPNAESAPVPPAITLPAPGPQTQRAPGRQKKRSLPPVDSGMVALNTRITPATANALLRASMERKIQRLEPFTQQDIVSEALDDWLRRNS